ncbi:MAG: threonine synthase [Candidatus Rokubacteria bacterium]|nr:threonine synthase [Candidatus Rokubacteria bacterium]
MAAVARIDCPRCALAVDGATPTTYCPRCGGVLEAHVDLVGLSAGLEAEIRRRPRGLWRWREFLPIADDASIVSLGEGDTPLVHTRRLAAETGLDRLWIKNDTLLPTGSLKDRSVTVSLSHAREVKASAVGVSSTGNHAASVAAYAAAAGLPAFVMIPAATAPGKVMQARAYGAHVIAVQGPFDRTSALFKEALAEFGWYSCLSANAWRNEGKKTYAFETWEQLGGEVPAWMIHPIAGGLGVTATWKGWRELNALGWARGVPRMVAAQAAAAAPIVRAWERGMDDPVPVTVQPTVAESIAVGAPSLGWRALRAVRETGGACVAGSDGELLAAQSLLARTTGIFCEPSAAASVAAALALRRAGRIRPDDLVVCVVTGHGLKQPEPAAARAEPVVTVEPSLADLEPHLRRWL